jgi:DNA-binding MarR family transcriptional regulator
LSFVRTEPKPSTRGLARLIEQVGKAAYNLGYTPGLNPAQWAALRYFDEATLERRTVTGFAQFQGTTKGTASQTVAAMVRKGYLRRVADKQDRRVHRLMLTEEGQTLLKSDPLQELSRALEALSDDERWSLAVNMEKVLRELLKAN